MTSQELPLSPRRFLKPVLAHAISLALGLVFLYSGYTKLWPLIETFEFTFVDIGAANWYTAPIIARLLIGLEIFVGVLLIAGYHLKRFTLPLTFALLLFFTIYLGITIMTTGNKGNCGCFGEHLHMTPLQAIIKNVLMMAAAAVIYFLYEGWKIPYNKLVLSLVFVSTLTLPFIINPVYYAYTSNNLDEKVNYPLQLNLLYSPEDTAKVEVPKVDLRSGKHVVAFLSLTCPHCRVAAKKFKVIKKNNPELPIYFILNGDKEKYAEFIEDTHADNIPYSYCLGKSFVQLATAQLPRLYYLDNGVVVKKVDYFELNQYGIENWLRTGKP
ncbi:MAG: DoxX family protein [Bacteroidia bacterium]|nr:DoxX family protein [Bacteroidia bacterium]